MIMEIIQQSDLKALSQRLASLYTADTVTEPNLRFWAAKALLGAYDKSLTTHTQLAIYECGIFNATCEILPDRLAMYLDCVIMTARSNTSKHGESGDGCD